MEQIFLTLKEAMRLSQSGYGVSAISRQVKIAPSTLRDRFSKAETLGLDYETLKALTLKDFVQVWNKGLWLAENTFEPNWEEMVLKAAAPNSSLSKVFEEYLASVPAGLASMGKSNFYKKVKEVRNNASPELADMCIWHSFAPAKVSMIDYSGDGIKWHDRRTNTERVAQIFVGILPFSGLIFCTATESQKREAWIGAMADMFTFFNGVTEELWLDNSTSLVRKADKYDPQISPEFNSFCRFYDVSPLPVEPGRPRHKAPVENAVGLVQRKILKELNAMKFFGIEEINRAITPLLSKLNESELSQHKGQTRLSRYGEEAAVLRPLPIISYDPCCTLMERKVLAGNQIRLKNARYTLPWGHVGKTVLVKSMPAKHQVQFILKDTGKFLCETTLRSPGEGRQPTTAEHLPEGFKHLAEDCDQLLERIAREYGGKGHDVAKKLISSRSALSKKHLIGFLHLCNLQKKDELEKVFRRLLEMPVLTFAHLQQELQKESSDRVQKRAGRGGAVLSVTTKPDVRGAEYYRRILTGKQDRGASNDK